MVKFGEWLPDQYGDQFGNLTSKQLEEAYKEYEKENGGQENHEKEGYGNQDWDDFIRNNYVNNSRNWDGMHSYGTGNRPQTTIYIN